MKKAMIYGSFVLAVVMATFGYFVPEGYWQSLVVNSATSFMALGVGIVFVNVYLEDASRRAAVRSLLVLANESIASFHNELLKLCWARFGSEEWTKLAMSYVRSKGSPESLSQDVRTFLYEAYAENPQTRKNVEALEETLTELSRMVSWNLSASLLKVCLDSRVSLARLKGVVLDNTPEAKTRVSEHLLDVDICSQRARGLLLEIAGMDDES